MSPDDFDPNALADLINGLMVVFTLLAKHWLPVAIGAGLMWLVNHNYLSKKFRQRMQDLETEVSEHKIAAEEMTKAAMAAALAQKKKTDELEAYIRVVNDRVVNHLEAKTSDSRSVYVDALKICRGVGETAAQVIDEASDMASAREAFNMFQASHTKIDAHKAYDAYENRLEKEGLGDSDEAFEVGWKRAEHVTGVDALIGAAKNGNFDCD